jgi:zinc finger RNA-binding protein
VTTYATPQTYSAPATGYSQTVTTVKTTAQQPTTNTTTYTNYDAALYSAATMYVAQQNNKTVNAK